MKSHREKKAAERRERERERERDGRATDVSLLQWCVLFMEGD